MQALIVQGDRSSHGGVVLGGSPFTKSDGQPVARVGDMVSCPQCKGVFPIVEGHAQLRDRGAPIAYHGCKTACGASLISSQTLVSAEPPWGGAASAHAGAVGARTGSIGDGLAAAYAHQAPWAADGPYRGRFRLVDHDSGEPIPGRQVQITVSDGDSILDLTDDEGYTSWIERDTAQTLALHLVDPTP